jgi:hypothetical protein
MKHLSREGQRLGFRIHAVAFVVVMLLLVGINLLTGPPYWVQWVLPGWSIGLLCHWWFVLGPGARGRGRADGPATDWRQHPQKGQQPQ